MLNAIVKPGVFKHITCRNNIYPKCNVQRFPVPDDYVFWSVAYKDYSPVEYTAKHINGQSWADPDINSGTFQPHWNKLDGTVNRQSHIGQYQVEQGIPVNPIGRTGLRGRGLLGRWGPNHAADPVVTRWKRNTDSSILKHAETKKQILQMIAIQRHNNKLWAIPGGMVDPGELVSATLKREFMEEALNSFDNQDVVEQFFSKGSEIYRGYVDDFRNTDNAWIETVAYNFHDDAGTEVGALQLCAGDDASNVRWIDLDHKLELHANHLDIIEQVVKSLDAHW